MVVRWNISSNSVNLHHLVGLLIPIQEKQPERYDAKKKQFPTR